MPESPEYIINPGEDSCLLKVFKEKIQNSPLHFEILEITIFLLNRLKGLLFSLSLLKQMQPRLFTNRKTNRGH